MVCDTEMESMKELRPYVMCAGAAIRARTCYICDKTYFVNHEELKYRCNSCELKEKLEKDITNTAKEAVKEACSSVNKVVNAVKEVKC